MSIQGLTNAGAMPSLELTMRFAAQRQRNNLHNIANFDTPAMVQRQASTAQFQNTLRDAIHARRAESGGRFGELNWQPTRELSKGPGGRLNIEPQTSTGGVMTHDQNNRAIELTLKDLTETAGVFRTASALYSSQRSILRDAISERP